MSVKLLPVIKLTKKKTGLAAYVEKKGFLPGVARVLTSPKTTIALGVTLGALLTGGALAPVATKAALRAAPGVLGRTSLKVGKKIMPTTLMGGAKLIGGAGIAYGLGVPGIKKVTKKIFKTGEKIGEIIDEPGKAADILGIKEDQTLKEKVITGLKAAGLVGAAAAVAIGGVAAVKKGKQILEERALKVGKPAQLEPGLKAMGFTEPRPVGLGGVPISPVPGIPTGAPGAPISRPGVSNIIQIQLM